MRDRIAFIQQELTRKGLYSGLIDGILNPAVLNAFNGIAQLEKNWSDRRKVVGYIQICAKENNIDTGPLDGYWGPQTEFAFNSLKYLREHNTAPPTWRPEELANRNPNNWPSQTPEQLLINFYGQVGTNQTMIELPYPHKLSWNKRQLVNRFSCHVKIHDSLKRVLTKVHAYYGMAEIERLRLDIWGGCLNIRQMRGGTRYSMHSWGIAVDYDPENNQLEWGRDRATFAKQEYNRWWEFWEEEGWVSLGRTRNFDWMHVQAAKI